MRDAERRQGPSPTSLPPAWASVRLIDGESDANYWRVDSAVPRAQLAVGTEEVCEWVVAAARVAPIHFELCWDGRRLWIGDTHRVGGVTVDGAPLHGWLPLTGRTR
ncbi:MAG TPA: FHA domain-containing protein, partial [Kofleriaceae bacterium]|nr:FHA domain-containing protein [Kofleriaceae bacterium]